MIREKEEKSRGHWNHLHIFSKITRHLIISALDNEVGDADCGILSQFLIHGRSQVLLIEFRLSQDRQLICHAL